MAGPNGKTARGTSGAGKAKRQAEAAAAASLAVADGAIKKKRRRGKAAVPNSVAEMSKQQKHQLLAWHSQGKELPPAQQALVEAIKSEYIEAASGGGKGRADCRRTEQASTGIASIDSINAKYGKVAEAKKAAAAEEQSEEESADESEQGVEGEAKAGGSSSSDEEAQADSGEEEEEEEESDEE